MFDKMNLMSFVDLFQLAGKIKQMAGALKGGKKEETPTEAPPKDEGVPQTAIGARFVKTDDAIWEELMKLLRSRAGVEAEKAIDDLLNGLKPHQTDDFRLSILNMKNRVRETERPARGRGKSTVKKHDPTGTRADVRVDRLLQYAKEVMNLRGKRRLAKIREIQSRFIQRRMTTEQSATEKVSEALKNAEEAFAKTAYSAASDTVLPREVLDQIKQAPANRRPHLTRQALEAEAGCRRASLRRSRIIVLVTIPVIIIIAITILWWLTKF